MFSQMRMVIFKIESLKLYIFGLSKALMKFRIVYIDYLFVFAFYWF